MSRIPDETTYDAVRLRRGDGVRWLVLDEPERRNPMSPAIMAGLQAACDDLEGDADARVVVLTGAGPVFSAGGDLRYNDQGFRGSPARVETFLTELYRPFLRILDLPMPTIAAVNGPAVGGGMAMTLLCDIRIAAADAVFVPAFASLGFVAGMGLTASLAHHVGRGTAAEILFADRKLTAEEARQVGLVERVVPTDHLDDEVAALAAAIAANGPQANRAMKALLTDAYRRQVKEQLSREIAAQVQSAGSEEYRERRERIAGRVGRED